MALTTVNGAFDELLKRIELNPSRVDQASARYKAVKETLEADLSGCKVFQIGSFQRKTKIRPDDENEWLDIDVGVCIGDFTEFASDGKGATPSTVLTKVKDVLERNKTYRSMNPKKDSPTISLEYDDGLKIEIVPCYRSTGRLHRPSPPFCYVVGKDNNAWQPADYDYDAQIIGGLNQIEKVKQSLIPSIKMVKRFLRNKGSRLRSFHVEILCAAIVPPAITLWENNRNYWGYKHVLAAFLSEAQNHLKGPISLPGSQSIPVDSGLSSERLANIGESLSHLGTKAWALCKLTGDNSTIRQWAEFYGNPFPTS